MRLCTTDPLKIVGRANAMLAAGKQSRVLGFPFFKSSFQVVGCALKAFCLAFAFVLSIVPAAADELRSSQNGLQVDDNEVGRLYRLEWLRQKIASETAAEASLDRSDAAEAEFAQKIRAMLALARQEIRRAEADPNPVRLEVHLHCAAKRVVVRSGTHEPFVPALEWSVATDAPAPIVATRVIKACAIKLIRSQPGVGQRARMVPYSVDLPPIEQAAQ